MKRPRQRIGSLTNANPQSYGTFSHLWPSAMTESARSTPAARCAVAGEMRGEQPERAVHVEPRAVPLGQVRHRRDRVEVAGVHLAGGRRHDRRRAVELAERRLERLEVEPPDAVAARWRTCARPIPSIASAFTALAWT